MRERDNQKDLERHESMRGYFAYELYRQMETNDKIFLITADLGWGMMDKIKADFPDRFLNVGASEQSAIGIAVGLAEMGKVPVVYSITPFLLYRPFETIRNYIDHERIPVKLIGGGRNDDYHIDGWSHHAFEDRQIMEILGNINAVWPQSKEEMREVVKAMIETDEPWYVNLRR